MTAPDKPDCYKCVHRRDVPGDCHSRCNKMRAQVKGNEHGIRNGWFIWPLNFDPVWLVSCDGFSDDTADNLPEVQFSPLEQALSLLGKRAL